MANKGRLVLELVDSRTRRIKEKVDLEFEHRTLAERKVARQVDATRKLSVRGLRESPKGLYKVYIDPPSYLPVHRFLTIPAGRPLELTLPMAVDPRKIRKVDFPTFAKLDPLVRDLLSNSESPLGFEGLKGSRLFTKLDNIRKAGFMNIIAKSDHTVLPNGRRVVEYIRRVTELRGDRFFAVVDHELREEVKNAVASGKFEPVSGALHHPPDDFDEAGSFKTDDRYGNLQVTFFARRDGSQWRADIDIDDASGLGHVFQVARNFLTGRPTNPYAIHEILLVHQDIDPGYDFVL